MELNDILYDYYKSVLEPFFPRSGEISRYSGLGSSSNDIIDDIKITTENTYDFFKESAFFINKGTEIVHFTSLQNAISIIKDLKLRLYNINSLEDPNEVKRISDIITELQNDNNFNIDNEKENFYVFCGSDYADIKNDKSAEFNMWRLYGNSGHGIGLVYKYDDDPNKIYKCFLSKVYYDTNSLFPQCLENHRKFLKDKNCLIYGLDNVLVPLSLFYKDHIYKIENEIRILKKMSRLQNRTNTIGFDFKNSRNVSYYELPFNSKTRGADPNLVLTKILIGYKYNINEKQEIENMFNDINYLNERISFDIEQTSLKDDYFSERQF